MRSELSRPSCAEVERSSPAPQNSRYSTAVVLSTKKATAQPCSETGSQNRMSATSYLLHPYAPVFSKTSSRWFSTAVRQTTSVRRGIRRPGSTDWAPARSTRRRIDATAGHDSRALPHPTTRRIRAGSRRPEPRCNAPSSQAAIRCPERVWAGTVTCAAFVHNFQRAEAGSRASLGIPTTWTAKRLRVMSRVGRLSAHSQLPASRWPGRSPCCPKAYWRVDRPVLSAHSQLPASRWPGRVQCCLKAQHGPVVLAARVVPYRPPAGGRLALSDRSASFGRSAAQDWRASKGRQAWYRAVSWHRLQVPPALRPLPEAEPRAASPQPPRHCQGLSATSGAAPERARSSQFHSVLGPPQAREHSHQ